MTRECLFQSSVAIKDTIILSFSPPVHCRNLKYVSPAFVTKSGSSLARFSTSHHPAKDMQEYMIISQRLSSNSVSVELT